jgi:hypothetical protein
MGKGTCDYRCLPATRPLHCVPTFCSRIASMFTKAVTVLRGVRKPTRSVWSLPRTLRPFRPASRPSYYCGVIVFQGFARLQRPRLEYVSKPAPRSQPPLCISGVSVDARLDSWPTLSNTSPGGAAFNRVSTVIREACPTATPHAFAATHRRKTC